MNKEQLLSDLRTAHQAVQSNLRRRETQGYPEPPRGESMGMISSRIAKESALAACKEASISEEEISAALE